MEKELQDFFRKYGTQTTTNCDLIEIAKKEGIKPFYYVMRDEVFTLPKTKTGQLKPSHGQRPEEMKLYVCTNLHTSKEPGIHHSCFVLDFENPDNNVYFDSYGLPPTEEVKKLLKHGTHNTFQLQKLGERYCGQLCLFVLKKLSENVPFEELILVLTHGN